MTPPSKPPLADAVAGLRGEDDVAVADLEIGRVDQRATPRRMRGKVAPPQWLIDKALPELEKLVATGVARRKLRIHQKVQDAWRKYHRVTAMNLEDPGDPDVKLS